MRTFIENIDNVLELKIIGECVRKHNEEIGLDCGIRNNIDMITCIGTHKEIYVDKYWIRRNKNLLRSVRKFLRVNAEYTGDMFSLHNFSM